MDPNSTKTQPKSNQNWSETDRNSFQLQRDGSREKSQAKTNQNLVQIQFQSDEKINFSNQQINKKFHEMMINSARFNDWMNEWMNEWKTSRNGRDSGQNHPKLVPAKFKWKDQIETGQLKTKFVSLVSFGFIWFRLVSFGLSLCGVSVHFNLTATAEKIKPTRNFVQIQFKSDEKIQSKSTNQNKVQLN